MGRDLLQTIGVKPLPSRLRRLDDALAGLPLDEPMLLTELDGFLTGILVCPEPVGSAEWLPAVWGDDGAGGAPFDDPADMRWFADAVLARYDEIAREVRRDRLRPIFDVDERNGETLWEFWLDGFEEAMGLRPDAWSALADGDDADAADACARLALLLAVAHDESDLDSIELDAVHDGAPASIAAIVLRLHAARPRGATVGEDAEPAGAPPPKLGRNDPCRCGSGKKVKRCCG